MGNHPKKQLTDHLKEVHALEEQGLAQLKKAPEVAGDSELAEALRRHHAESVGHEQRIRTLIEDQGEHVSRTKDAWFRLGGKGFLLFARARSDTPGKLASHALAFEALEWAAHDILARTAERVGEEHTAAVAREIRDQERAMMRRIESILERTAPASLREATTDDLQGHLKRRLADAHALEEQSIELLESGREAVKGTPLRSVFRIHLQESRRQRDLLEERLEAAGGRRSMLKDAALRVVAAGWRKFFEVQSDRELKLGAFAYAFEHLEIGGYMQLRWVAREAGDAATVAAVERILTEERGAAERIAAAFDQMGMMAHAG